MFDVEVTAASQLAIFNWFYFSYTYMSSCNVVFYVVNNNWSIRYIDITFVLQLLIDISHIDCDIDFIRDIFPL